MLDRLPKWILKPQIEPPSWFLQQVQRYVQASSGRNAAKILWQRGIQDAATLAEFIHPQEFKPSSPFEFGWEMQWAVERILHAAESGEKVAIWGDFDADGITSTSVLWDGLGQFFPQSNSDSLTRGKLGGGRLVYYIPDRLTESHGLNIPGIDRLGELDINLIVTCDTGSTNLAEINYANQLGIDTIVTDHHTLLEERPPVVAIINPRSLPADHAMADLSGVAVAYKLIEALYLTEPNIPQKPLEELLDLVAIGLIADLVALKGDCRYLAQVGLKHLEAEFKQNPSQWRRPGVGRLLELCKKTGDRPTDISFGIGPRINAVSRIYGDASFCVELLTSRDRQHCEKLARETELANTRRQELQKNVLDGAKKKLEQIDLSTTSAIVLEDPQWPVGVLGLVAGQIAQEYGRPTILLTTDAPQTAPQTAPKTMARGSARSVNQIDLYQLVKSQEHLLDRFGGHPFAAGLSLPVENIPLFTEAINRELRQKLGEFSHLGLSTVEADIICVVAELGQDLFRELKLLEPCGMGNPSPQILIQNCWFEKVWHSNIRDASGRKIKYIKTEFKIKDDSSESGFEGIWWGHYKEEIPQDKNNPENRRCDAVVELDYNTYKQRYEVRLIAVREVRENSQDNSLVKGGQRLQILDYRNSAEKDRDAIASDLSNSSVIPIDKCPTSWEELEQELKSALDAHKNQRNPEQTTSSELPVVILDYHVPNSESPLEVLQELVGIAKYLSQTGETVSHQQLRQKLRLSDRTLSLGLKTLASLGFEIIQNPVNSGLPDSLKVGSYPNQEGAIALNNPTINHFLLALEEEQFYRQYFSHVPLATLQEAIDRILSTKSM